MKLPLFASALALVVACEQTPTPNAPTKTQDHPETPATSGSQTPAKPTPVAEKPQPAPPKTGDPTGATSSTPSGAAPAKATSADTAALVAGDTAFAFDLYQKVSAEKGNLFLSPFSVSAALGMTYAGAKG